MILQFTLAMVATASFAVLFCVPKDQFLLSSLPGAGIYYTSYYFIINDMASFAAKGIETFKIAGAIAVGIIFGFSIPQKAFQWKGWNTKS